jgi:hypothetical protein
MIDGLVRAQTDESGAFHIAGLEPGVYRIHIDDENLPFDYAPDRTALGVEVAAGRATPVEVPLALRLGAAGRVLDAGGEAIADAEVVLTRDDGSIATRQRTDGYGYFRLSDLPPGRYRLTIAGAPSVIGRDLELTDRYLFEQDLVLE